MNKDIEKSMRTMCHQVQYVNKTREKLTKKEPNRNPGVKNN